MLNHKKSKFYFKKGNKCTISLCILSSWSRHRGRIFLRLRLQIFFGEAPALGFVFKQLRLQVAKNMQLLAAPAPQPFFS